MATLLLEYGAEVDARGAGGCTPLQIAALAGHMEAIRLFLRQKHKPIYEVGNIKRPLS